MKAIGLDPGAALVGLARAGLVTFAHTGADGLIFPTATFHATSETIVPSQITSQSARELRTVTDALAAEPDRVAFASVLAPFVSAGWNVLVVNQVGDARRFWLTMRRGEGGDVSEGRDRYSTGMLGLLLDPSPDRATEQVDLAGQEVVWLAGAPEHTASVQRIPSSVDIWRADLLGGVVAHWVPPRSAPDRPLR